MPRRFPSTQVRVLSALAARGAPVLVPELVAALGLDQSVVSAAATELHSQGLVTVTEEAIVEVRLTEEGAATAAGRTPLLERRIAVLLRDAGAPLELADVAARLGVEQGEVGKVLRYVLAKGWAKKDGKALAPTGVGALAEGVDEAFLAEAYADPEGKLDLAPARAEDATTAQALRDLRSRGLLKTRDRARRHLALTAAAQALVADGLEEAREVTQLTEAMLLSGEWRDVTFRAYDVSLDVAPLFPARSHPLRRVLEEARRAFLNLGFTEIRGPYVESAFWDFDALYQPQDHPARDMQDTFYCKHPARSPLPDEALVEAVRRTHEDGGDTGSTGWRYRWSRERAQQVVLRTHTTAVTVAACHADPQPPQKLFCVGRVFRREAIDYKHLPEFHQVEGIIIDEHASLAGLLGLLREFYRQMGFTEVKFRPDFFPYTEPSVGVHVRMPGRRAWFELGGAGVFRPEVTRPAGVKVPVLAWGLGLERLAMVRYGVQDIRELYASHLDWLKESALCR